MPNQTLLNDTRRLRICVVSSAGGHLRQVTQLLPALAEHDCFLVLNDAKPAGLDLPMRKYLIARAQRDWRVLINFAEAFRILRQERPDVIVSAGAGCVVPFAVLGRLFGAKTLYLETASALHRPTLTGRIMYHLADRFIYQWPELQRWFPKARYGGLIYDFHLPR